MKSLIAAGLFTTVVAANANCAMDGEALKKGLQEQFGEVSTGVTLETNSPLVETEFLANPEKGNWTQVTNSLLDGSTCIVMAGKGWGGIDPSLAQTEPTTPKMDAPKVQLPPVKYEVKFQP